MLECPMLECFNINSRHIPDDGLLLTCLESSSLVPVQRRIREPLAAWILSRVKPNITFLKYSVSDNFKWCLKNEAWWMITVTTLQTLSSISFRFSNVSFPELDKEPNYQDPQQRRFSCMLQVPVPSITVTAWLRSRHCMYYYLWLLHHFQLCLYRFWNLVK